MRYSDLEAVGFVPVTNEILVCERESGQDRTSNTSQPDLILVFGWGNALPQHVAKYSEGFRQLYPGAKQIVVLSQIATTLYGDLPYRTRTLQPLVKVVLSDDTDSSHSRGSAEKQRVLVHCMSNTGGIKYAAFLNAYRQTCGHAFPHSLIVFDSTPGSPYLTTSNIGRWSRSMTVNTAAWFPWPAFLTQAIWAAFLCLNWLVEKALQRQSAAEFSAVATNKELWEVRSAHRRYIYSKEDSLIGWRDIEDHAERAQDAGYVVGLTIFQGSAHVAHMRSFPQRYWSTISSSWDQVVLSQLSDSR